VLIIHDFARVAANMFELALQLVLNGYVCMLVDMEGMGYSGGTRVTKMSLENWQHQISAMVLKTDPALPMYFAACGYGSLALTNYLHLNP
jgi:alpha-beta hydrolase superfamily lysophospholipase